MGFFEKALEGEIILEVEGIERVIIGGFGFRGRGGGFGGLVAGGGELFAGFDSETGRGGYAGICEIDYYWFWC